MISYKNSIYNYTKKDDHPLVYKHLKKMEYLAYQEGPNKESSVAYFISGEPTFYDTLEELVDINPECPIEGICMSFGIRNKDSEGAESHMNVSVFKLVSVNLNTYTQGLFKSGDILPSISTEYTTTDTVTHSCSGIETISKDVLDTPSVHQALNNYSKYKNLDAKNKLIVAEAIMNLIDNLSEQQGTL